MTDLATHVGSLFPPPARGWCDAKTCGPVRPGQRSLLERTPASDVVVSRIAGCEAPCSLVAGGRVRQRSLARLAFEGHGGRAIKGTCSRHRRDTGGFVAVRNMR